MDLSVYLSGKPHLLMDYSSGMGETTFQFWAVVGHFFLPHPQGVPPNVFSCNPRLPLASSTVGVKRWHLAVSRDGERCRAQFHVPHRFKTDFTCADAVSGRVLPSPENYLDPRRFFAFFFKDPSLQTPGQEPERIHVRLLETSTRKPRTTPADETRLKWINHELLARSTSPPPVPPPASGAQVNVHRWRWCTASWRTPTPTILQKPAATSSRLPDGRSRAGFAARPIPPRPPQRSLNLGPHRSPAMRLSEGPSSPPMMTKLRDLPQILNRSCSGSRRISFPISTSNGADLRWALPSPCPHWVCQGPGPGPCLTDRLTHCSPRLFPGPYPSCPTRCSPVANAAVYMPWPAENPCRRPGAGMRLPPCALVPRQPGTMNPAPVHRQAGGPSPLPPWAHRPGATFPAPLSMVTGRPPPCCTTLASPGHRSVRNILAWTAPPSCFWMFTPSTHGHINASSLPLPRAHLEQGQAPLMCSLVASRCSLWACTPAVPRQPLSTPLGQPRHGGGAQGAGDLLDNHGLACSLLQLPPHCHLSLHALGPLQNRLALRSRALLHCL
ncbi:hypothetical protein PAPYR_4734 [Paratrimastix pyriformis]|uniref:Uncharacterized protein n=1 Tax=Paratrimastix pyriformis TaxID=342808 RepID=A0ABQ8UMI5_9EUKA|nr:hypothetical protein PAPYR_4734 [Paratrimastix pyriformis]